MTRALKIGLVALCLTALGITGPMISGKSEALFKIYPVFLDDLLVGLAQAEDILVLNTFDSGAGSLRDAINRANNNSGPDTIYFANSLKGRTISPASPLPYLTDSGTVIDGSFLWDGSWPTGRPGITLDGILAGPDAAGLRISNTQNVSIKGLAIQHFDFGLDISRGHYNTIGSGATGGRVLIRNCRMGINLGNSHHNRIIGCYIGTSDAGNLPEPNLEDGVSLYSSAQNIIGGTGPLEYNLIGGNGGYGISIYNEISKRNEIRINWIGVGTLDGNIANTLDGIFIDKWAEENVIGSEVLFYQPGVVINPKEGNIIINNLGNGITVNSKNNYVVANVIDRNTGNGIELTEQAEGNQVVSNTIIRNEQSGILLDGGQVTKNEISQNYLGTDSYLNAGLGNYHHGIGLYDGAFENRITRNVITANGWSGAVLVGPATVENRLEYNHIGLGIDGRSMGNQFYGVHINSGRNNYLTGNRIAYNGINNGEAGVRIEIGNRNSLFMNSIYSNSGLGIELANYGNEDFPSPVIQTAQRPLVTGSCFPFFCGSVSIFSDNENEGRYFEGVARADINGNWSYRGSIRGPFITATAHEYGTGNTSAFSSPFPTAGWALLYLPLIMR
jgi:hypothetical protein